MNGVIGVSQIMLKFFVNKQYKKDYNVMDEVEDGVG
jgi:hypothetical protein